MLRLLAYMDLTQRNIDQGPRPGLTPIFGADRPNGLCQMA